MQAQATMTPMQSVFSTFHDRAGEIEKEVSPAEEASPTLNVLKKMHANRTQKDMPWPLFAPPVHIDDGPS
jgi:hypothetical protein